MPFRSSNYQALVQSAPRARIGRTTAPVKEILTLFPLTYWAEASAVPIGLDRARRRCRIAIADDQYGAVVDDIGFVTGFTVDLVRVSKAVVERLLASSVEER